MPRRTGAKVRSVVTYNFDDLIERQLSANNIIHRCIYTENETYDPDELPVYHVHGFLPEDRKKYDKMKLEDIINYLKNNHSCRSQLLLQYFDEENSSECGICDVCIRYKRKNISRDSE